MKTTPRTTPTIRPCHRADHDALECLWRTAFPNDPPRNNPADVIRRKLALDDDLLLVATVNNRLVGAAIAGYDGFRGWISHLAVDPAYRRQGIGHRLVTACEQRLAALDCPKVNLQARTTNTEVIAFYRKLGYTVEERASLGKAL